VGAHRGELAGEGERSHVGVEGEIGPQAHGLDVGHELLDEVVVDIGMHVDAFHRLAQLAGRGEAGADGTLAALPTLASASTSIGFLPPSSSEQPISRAAA